MPKKPTFMDCFEELAHLKKQIELHYEGVAILSLREIADIVLRANRLVKDYATNANEEKQKEKLELRKHLTLITTKREEDATPLKDNLLSSMSELDEAINNNKEKE